MANHIILIVDDSKFIAHSYSKILLWRPRYLERNEPDRRDEVAIIRVKLNAENAVRMMVEKLILLKVSEKEIADAIEHLKHVAKTKAIPELRKRYLRTG